jgi:hypothetical protein
MKFNQITIVLSPVDDESGSVKVHFDPPLPDNEEEIDEDQPVLALLDTMLASIQDEYDKTGEGGEVEYLQ